MPSFWSRRPTSFLFGALAAFTSSCRTAQAAIVCGRAQPLQKIPGFTDEDVEKATNCSVLWKIPNNYQVIGPAIDKGAPVAAQGNHEIGRSYQALAAELAGATTSSEGALSLLYQHEKVDINETCRRSLNGLANARRPVIPPVLIFHPRQLRGLWRATYSDLSSRLDNYSALLESGFDKMTSTIIELPVKF